MAKTRTIEIEQKGDQFVATNPAIGATVRPCCHAVYTYTPTAPFLSWLLIAVNKKNKPSIS
jgi:hypothetical protein